MKININNFKVCSDVALINKSFQFIKWISYSPRLLRTLSCWTVDSEESLTARLLFQMRWESFCDWFNRFAHECKHFEIHKFRMTSLLIFRLCCQCTRNAFKSHKSQPARPKWMLRRNFHSKLNLHIWTSADVSYAWKCVWPSVFSHCFQRRKKAAMCGLSNNVSLDWLTISSVSRCEAHKRAFIVHSSDQFYHNSNQAAPLDGKRMEKMINDADDTATATCFKKSATKKRPGSEGTVTHT